MNQWYEMGIPIDMQDGRAYLTYKAYCQSCREEGITPVGKTRFRTMMMQRGLRLAAQDRAKFERMEE